MTSDQGAESAAIWEAADVDEIEIDERGIRLGRLLKLTGIVETGGAVKDVLADGVVTVNGAVETRRGAQLAIGDIVTCGDARIRVVSAAAASGSAAS
jgi:ribosome-associated protein